MMQMRPVQIKCMFTMGPPYNIADQEERSSDLKDGQTGVASGRLEGHRMSKTLMLRQSNKPTQEIWMEDQSLVHTRYVGVGFDMIA